VNKRPFRAEGIQDEAIRGTSLVLQPDERKYAGVRASDLRRMAEAAGRQFQLAIGQHDVTAAINGGDEMIYNDANIRGA
jgi:hypothetical protein